MASLDARAFWILAPGRGDILDEAIAPPGEGDVLVRTLFSAVSRGTESLVFEGRVPPGERERMRAPFQAGSFPAPVKYGYASVGVVEAGPASLLHREVFALHPHQTRFCVPASAVYPLPPGVPAARGVLAANLETAINGTWDAHPGVGDRVVVIGGGVVGCLVAWLIGRIPGAEVTLVDVNPGRRAVAASLGVRFAVPDDAPPEADLVVHASGSPAGLQLALRLAAFEATILEMSWYGDRPVTLPLGEAFHARRLTIRSSQVGHVAEDQRSRWDHTRRMMLALALLEEEALDVLVSGESPFEDLPSVMPQLASASGGALCHRIRY
jgi:hypothetical protein